MVKKFGKIRHGQAEIGGRIFVGPGLGEIPAAAAGDIEACGHFGDLEPRPDTTITSAGCNSPLAVTIPSRVM